MHSREQYLDKVRAEYEKADKAARGCLLDEAQKRTGMCRKYLIRKLGQPFRPRLKKGRRKRRASYDGPVIAALVRVWEIFDFPCGQRLQPVLQREVQRLRALGELRCSPELAEKLGQISAKTLDRVLAHEKQVRLLRRNRNPAVHPLLYQKIPVRVPGDWDRDQVGNVQVDFVAHCGRSASGEFVHTVSTVDIASGWWEGQAIAGRSQQATKEGLDVIRQRLPFRLREIHPDNDSSMINHLLWRYCKQHRIQMSRSRPYKKNDNAWVEQKNWTHVRKVVGYRRYDTMRELALLNQIYGLLRLYKNFCQPVMKLKRKTRVGGKIHRVYDKPRTPCERLLESGQLDKKGREQLRQVYESLNPAELHRQLERLRNELFELSEAREGMRKIKPGRRGPALRLGRGWWSWAPQRQRAVGA